MKPASRKRAVRIALTMGIAFWLLAPITIIGAISYSASNAAFTEPRSVLISPIRNDGAIARPVQIGLKWGESANLISPDWDGIVEEIFLSPSDMVNDGTPILQVGGIIRTAAATEMPFTRSLTAGDEGRDVTQLQQFLTKRGFETQITGMMDVSTMDSLRRWAETIGILGSGSTITFEPSWLVYLPYSSTVQEITAQVGAPAPTFGTSLAELRPRLEDAALMADGTDLMSSLDVNDDTNNGPLSPTESASESETLIYSDTQLQLDASNQRLTDQATQKLSDLIPLVQPTVSAILSREGADSYWKVPASAVITSSPTSTCVSIKSGNNKTTSIDVDIVLSIGGEVIIDAMLEEDQKIIIYPVSENPQCL